MKKAEFLENIKGHTIRVDFFARSPKENGKPYFDGLPESVKCVHDNQLLKWLMAWVPYTERVHPNLKYWERESINAMKNDDAMNYERSSERFLTACDWEDWCEIHPSFIFKA